MPTYNVSPQILVAQGHNNTAGYSAFTLRPRCPGLIYPERRYSLSGKAYNDGGGQVFLDFGPRTPAHIVDNALTVCGLSRTVLYANVTVRIPDNDDRSTARDYNGIAYYPQEWDYERSGWNSFVMQIGFLEVI